MHNAIQDEAQQAACGMRDLRFYTGWARRSNRATLRRRNHFEVPPARGAPSVVAMRGAVLWALLAMVATALAATRTYYIAAEEIEWDYLPLGRDAMSGAVYNETSTSLRKRDGVHTGSSTGSTATHGHGAGAPASCRASTHAPAATYVTATNHTVGRRHIKAVYRQYTDIKFDTKVPTPPEWAHLGLLGPVIRAEVGDVIHVYFHNHASRPYSMHPHGVAYTRSNAGVPLPNSSGLDGNLVPPESSFMYEWSVPERAGPGPSDPSSILWMYHSHVDEVADTNSGLIGPLIITRKGAARSGSDPRPRDVSREMVVCFNIYDENESPYLNASVAAYMPTVPASDAEWAALLADATFVEGNKKHTVNGLLYSNVPALNMTQGERVRWYVFGLGSENDVHGVHWHGQTLLHAGSRYALR